jgi:hypothetical protein
VCAFAGEKDKARRYLNEAKRKRGDTIVEPSAFTVLMLAEGEVALAEGNYKKAIENLGRAGFKLATTGHKDFEHMETVIRLLLEQVPGMPPAQLEELRQLRDLFQGHVGWLGMIELPRWPYAAV